MPSCEKIDFAPRISGVNGDRKTCGDDWLVTMPSHGKIDFGLCGRSSNGNSGNKFDLGLCSNSEFDLGPCRNGDNNDSFGLCSSGECNDSKICGDNSNVEV